MIALSHTTGYAILALGCMAEGHWVMARDIARCTGIPLPYLSKILHLLRQSGVILAKRGYRGGFQLARDADQVNLLEVVTALEGKECVGSCMLGLQPCIGGRHCPLHKFWTRERSRIESQLRRTTVATVARYAKGLSRECPNPACSLFTRS